MHMMALRKRSSTPRYLYYHTDEFKLQHVYQALNISGPVNLRTAPPAEDQEAWFRELTKAENQGCSHVKFMLSYPELYKTNTTLGQLCIKAFFDILWNYQERAFLTLDIWEGAKPN